jgi:hypothetical protein
METMYLWALGGVAAVLVAVTADAVLSVSRPARWPSRRTPVRLVPVAERRGDERPFVGRDRRGGDTPASDGAAGGGRRAA